MASQSEPSSFSMRIVSVDYYMSPPIPDLDICYSSFHGGDIVEVPVIRIYGSTLSGQKTCLHVHRVLPYLYVPCSDILHNPQEGYAYTQLISHQLEKALKSKSSAGSKRQHVHGCSLVRAKRFYGYHSTEELFTKIYLYHPHEVGRAAALLMSGSVLNRSFQPYESHFPYLLQFLDIDVPFTMKCQVDYNLYGMGLIQLSKVKFRHPLPVKLNSRAFHHINMYNILCRRDAEKFPAESESSQADLGSEACQDPTGWLSSTIPNSWMWPSVTEHGCSPDQGMHHIRRHSTCELEADTSVDEILNQQFKMYTSLSQARSDVKMVQSLLPIWEEYERTGVHEIRASPDPNKPQPETVLRNFTCGLEFETALLNLSKAAQNSSSQVSQDKDEEFVKSVGSLSDSALEEHLSPVNPHGESMKSLKEIKIGCPLPEILQSEKGGDAESLGQMIGCWGLSPAVEKTSSADMLENSDTKVADFDALGLLRWLASSQAMEDLSTDDELIHEPILSPLLPLKAIEKVLEKARSDYESESQQECQDILDSVESKKPAQCSDDCGHSSNGTIPQVDGSFDDPCTPVQMDKSSDAKIKNEVHGASLCSALQDSGKGCLKRNKTKKLWGSLPLSRKPKLHGDSDSSLNSDETCLDEARSSSDAKSSADKQLDYLTKMANIETRCCASKDGKILAGCSVRDLMRRKRCNQFDLSESGSPVKKKVVSSKDWAGETCTDLVHHALQNVEHPIISCGTIQIKSSLANVNDHRSAVKARHIGSATSESRTAFEVSRLKPSCNSFSRYGKLPLPCPERKLQDDLFFKHFEFQDNPREKERDGNSGESEDILELPQLVVPSIQVPDCSMPDQQCCTDGIESFEAKVSSDSTCFRPLKNVVQSRETDLPLAVSVLKSDEEAHIVPGRASLLAGNASCIDDNSIVKTDREVHVATGDVLDIPSGHNIGTNSIFDTSELHIENKGVDFVISRSAAETRLCADVSAREMETELIEMSFWMKPPAANCTDWNSGDPVRAPFVQCGDFLVDLDNSDEKQLSENNLLGFEEGNLDDCAPFFASNCQESKDTFGETHTNREIPNTEYAFGVPTHCQNDGSFLYLLTPAFSPPSLDSVSQWLAQLDCHYTTDISPGFSKTNADEVLTEPSSPKYDGGLRVITEENSCSNQGKSSYGVHEVCRVSYNDLINPQGTPAIASCRTSESNSSSNAHSVADQLNQQNQWITGTGIKESHNYMMPIGNEGERNIGKGQGRTENWQEFSQISGPEVKSKLTPLSQIGFCDPASVGAGQQLTLLSVEVLTESRANLRPDPRFDAINIIALAIQEDSAHSPEVYLLMRVNDKESCERNINGVSGCKVISTSEEKLLFDHFVKIVCSTDPDILMGWEIQGASLGFLAERAAHLGIGLLKKISRVPAFEPKVASDDLDDCGKGIGGTLLPDAIVEDPAALEDSIIEDEWGRTHASGVHVGGRIVLNIWRIMRSEIKLNMYTIEAVTEAVLRRRIPSIPSKTLSNWFSSGPSHARFRCIEHSMERAKLNLEIMHQLDMINRTSELARVFGIDFFSVLSRGSQYRVESMFLRLAHSQNYLAISPQSQQVASQPAMECLPLVMEPESGFYADPVVVLDFQSLYPSMIIAYNLCFCTCLGSVRPSKANTLGVSSFSPDPKNLRDLKDQLLLTPNGIMYVPPKIRKGVLPRLLEEILSTRIMVKKAMKKLAPSQQVLHRIFNARQLALKLIANVTYGYTAAGFSGRMPCAELADSIVQCGRRTLETAICFVNDHENWNARVIYGDTDSMFVLLKGQTVEQAFKTGQEIASAVTAMNPNPVTLKMEKVYYPCVLLTKKRYVGYSYESPDQIKPIFDAKGIETVRRDTCAAVAKTLEQSLRILFEHQDISMVKEYLYRQWTRILSGKVSLQDFVFAKEVRLGTYRSSLMPPAALVAVKAMKADPRSEPRYGERVPYVVIHGEPGARLIDMVVDPLELLDINSPYRLNDLYYINKQIIPALQRVFGLMGADLNKWFLEMPRPVRPTLAKRHLHASESGKQCDEENAVAIWRKVPANKTRIDSYYLSRHCTLCGELVQGSEHLCGKCSRKGPVVAAAVIGRTSKLEKEIHHLCAICRHCGGGDWLVEVGVKCTSLACSVFYERRKVQKELRSLAVVSTEAGFYPRCMVEWF